MDFKKDLSNVAAEVAKIMEAELSAKQKKIAQMSEPEHKIDAGDLAKLRAGHKPVKEETITEDDLPITTKKPKTVTVKHKTSGKELNVVDTPSVREKYKTMGYHPMKEEVEQVEEGIEDKIEAARKKAKAAGKPMKEPKKEVPMKRKVEGKAYGGAKQKEEMEESVLPFTAMLEAYTEHGLKAFVNEQVEEEIQEEVDYLEEAKDGKINLTHAFKEHGKHWSNLDYYTNAGARKGVETKKYETALNDLHKRVTADHGKKVADDMHKHSQAMADDWYGNEHSSKDKKEAAAIRAKHKVRWNGSLDEEVDNETYTKEVEDQKASMEGKKKQPKVAAAATQSVAVQKEEVEQIEEEVEQLNEYKEHIQALADHLKKNGSSMSASEFRTMHGHLKKLQDTVQDLKDTASQRSRGIKKHTTTQYKGKDEKHTHIVTNNDGHTLRIDTARYNPEDHTEVKTKSGKVIDHGKDRVATIIKKHGEGAYAKHFKESVEQVEERSLTEPEMKKKEEVVKSMKKNLKGFKERYGERAKSVMYDTATKMAKKD